MRVVCVQYDIVWEDKAATCAKVRSLLAAAATAPGALIILPEMFSTGFSMNVPAIAEGEDGPAHRFLAQVAREQDAFIIGGVTGYADDGRGCNEAAIYSPQGTLVACYQKIHPFSYGGEERHYSAGNRIVTFDCGRFVVCPFICYDLRFPEIFRAAVKRGANLFVVIANWPASRHEHWLALSKARAIENQAYVAAVNRVGQDPHVSYLGSSLIIDPLGQIIADAGPNERLIEADLSIDAVTDWRARFPALRDIRSGI